MTFPKREPRTLLRHCTLWGVVLLLVLSALKVRAAPETGAPAASEQIQISADHLEVNNTDQSAAFSGNVTAVQGATRISADRLTVFYEATDTDTFEKPGQTGAIRRIVSEGNVIIHFDDKVAVTQKAIYNKSTGILELIGEGTRVTSGQNTITGKRITVDRARDNITVEGDGSKRVEAVIFPAQADGGGLLPPAPPAGTAGQPAP
ncbi:MAG: lipopolysaccharide transport periplasmic protein LptA [Pseudomonadota bacterium]